MLPVKLAALRLRQRDGVTCGPTVAVVAGALLDPAYREKLFAADGDGWFTREQGRLHAEVNKIWPRRLGTTPLGMARALNAHSATRYGWRRFRGAGDDFKDVQAAVADGWPVAMLLGDRVLPRHWVLIIDGHDAEMACYEPSSGTVRPVTADEIRAARLRGLGFSRPHAFVMPKGFA